MANSNRQINNLLTKPSPRVKTAYTHGYDSRQEAGYPESLKTMMMEIAFQWDVMLATRVGNPPHFRIPAYLATKTADIKTKTAPALIDEGYHYISSPARGTIIKQQEIFGKEGSARVPAEESKFTFLPYPTTLRELFKFVDEKKLEEPTSELGEDGQEYFVFKTKGDFKPTAVGEYKTVIENGKEKEKLHFNVDAVPPTLSYRICKSDLKKAKIEGIYSYLEKPEDEKNNLPHWLKEERDKVSTERAHIQYDLADLDKPVPLYYSHTKAGEKAQPKIVEVLALKDKNDDPRIIIGDDDTFSISPSIAFIKFLKDKIAETNKTEKTEFNVSHFLQTNPQFNATEENIKQIAIRLSYMQQWLLEYRLSLLQARGYSGDLTKVPKHLAAEAEAVKKELADFNREDYAQEMIANKLGNIDSCGDDGMSIFELAYSLEVNKRFAKANQNVGQFIQHPPEARNHGGPSALLNENIMHINNGTYITTSNEYELVSYYLARNLEGNTLAEKFPILAQKSVVVSDVWLDRTKDGYTTGQLTDGDFKVTSEGDFWWPVVAIQMALGQKEYIPKRTYDAFINYLEKHDMQAVLAIMKKIDNNTLNENDQKDLIQAVDSHMEKLAALFINSKKQNLQTEFGQLFTPPHQTKDRQSMPQSVVSSVAQPERKFTSNNSEHPSLKTPKAKNLFTMFGKTKEVKAANDDTHSSQKKLIK